MKDKLVILPDNDGDGVADEMKVFAHVNNPAGFEFWNGGVIVTSGPDLLFLKDTDGASARIYQVRPEGDGFKMFKLMRRVLAPVPANAVLSSNHFPDAMQNQLLICGVIGAVQVKSCNLHRDGYEGREVGEVWGEPDKDMFKTEDKNVRTTDVVFGERGAMYISDWHNPIIGHAENHIRDPNRDHEHGRIYRLTRKGAPLQEPVAIDGEPIPKLLENLKHSVNGVRHRTRVELSERSAQEVIAATRNWIKPFDADDPKEAHHLLEALWLHQQFNAHNKALLNRLLKSEVDHARIAAEKVEHYWTINSTEARATAQQAETPDAQPTKVPAHLSGKAAGQYKLGAKVYARPTACISCHQPDGQGLGDTYPPLAGARWVEGDEERLTKLVLHGIWGPIEIDGKQYGPDRGVPPMTPFKSLLNDEELAAVLTYVRNSWGNKAPAVDAETIRRIREQTKERATFWKPEELLEAHPFPKEK